MKILFLCGSFEPGRDGVGDYTRRLAEELIRTGHKVAVAAIDDKHIGVMQDVALDMEQLNVLRLPFSLAEDVRMELLKDYIRRFDPEWLSLQFVPFSFHPRGLNFGLAKKLAVIGKGRKWHIMFHELWVGMAEGSRPKEIAWGILQQYLIRKMLRHLLPVAVHTHTATYRKYLEKVWTKVTLLPLFSNIPVVHSPGIDQKAAAQSASKDTISIILFGGIHHGAPIREFAAEAGEYSAAHQREIELVIVGRSGTEQQHWVEEWRNAGLKVNEMGEQPAGKVSEILAAASYGIFTTPLALVEKSGSVAAMREHGLHLLCVSRPWQPKGVKVDGNPFGILPYYKGGLNLFLNSEPDFSILPTLPAVAEQFVMDLTKE